MEMEYRLTLADERTLACLALGVSAGEPVMYFHGYPGSRLEARLAAAAAARLGICIYSLDRPGFGGSTFQPGRTLRDWAGDVTQAADQLGLDRFGVVGVSGGGPYALACAALIPQRLHGVALVCALGPRSAGNDTAGMVLSNRIALGIASRVPFLARFGVKGAARRLRRDPAHWVAYMMKGAPAADRAVLEDPAYRALFAQSMAEAVHSGGQGAAWDLTLLAGDWDLPLCEVPVSVRIWQGLDDNIVPPATARYLEATLPHGEAHYLGGEGHLSLIVHHMDAILAEL